MSNGGCLTARISESPSRGSGCILSDILMEDVPGKRLPFPKANGTALIQVHAGKQGERVYAEEGLSCTLTSGAGGMGGKTGLYEVGIPIKENTRKGYKMAYEGDSIDLDIRASTAAGEELGKRPPILLTTGNQQGTLHFGRDPPSAAGNRRCKMSEYQTGFQHP